MTDQWEFEVALRRLLGCACIFSLGPSHVFGHANTHWFGLTSLHRRGNDGIMGSQIYQEEVNQHAVGNYSSRVKWWCILALADLPTFKTGAETQHRHSLLTRSLSEKLRDG